jgi:membrane protease YdiL (CAAX protease family)
MLPQMVLYEMIAWDHVIASIICIFAPVLAFTSRRINMEDIRLEPEDKIKLYHSNGLLLFVFAMVVITLWRIPGRTLSGLGFEWPQWNVIVILLLLLVFLFYGLDIFFQYGLRRWRIRTMERRHASLAFVPADKSELLHFSFLALAAGVGEEIIFRGYLIQYVIFWTGNTPVGIFLACLFSSALFAFLHGYQGLVSMIKIFFLALVFSAIFVYSQSLLLVIIVHTVIDLVSGWLGIHLVRYIKQEENTQEEKN